MRPTDQPYAAFPFIEDTRYPDGSYLAGMAWQEGDYPTLPEPYTVTGATMADCLANFDARFPQWSAWHYTIEVRYPLFCGIDDLATLNDALNQKAA